MALRETVERLRRARAEPEEPGHLVAKWQEDVSRLYDTIAGWLAPYVEDGGIVLTRQMKAAEEASTGAYEIDQLDIDVGSETVRLDPRATVVIGGRGRIDMSHLGSGDPLLLILHGPDEDLRWSLVDRSVRAKMTPLTKQTFEAALDGLLEDHGPSSEPRM